MPIVRPSAVVWIVVVLGFLALAFSFSARAALSMAMPVWESELDWSRSFVSGAGALALVVMAAVAPIAGNTVDRYGPRALLAVGLCTIGGGMLLTAMASERWQFILAFSLLGGIGFGVVAMHVVATAVAPLFTERRGLATGVATSGATAGQLLLVPLFAVLLGVVGWRIGFVALGLAALALVPLVWWLLGSAGGNAHAEAGGPEGSLAERLTVLARSPVFHALFWAFTICGFTSAGVIEVHLLPYAAACGFPPVPSATAYGVLMTVNLMGMIAAGYLTDRMNRPLLLAIIYFMRGLTFILLLFIARDISMLFLFAVLFGAFDYATVPVTASLVSTHLGLKVMGLAMGLLSAGHALGAAAGAYFGGVIFDVFARYDWVWISSVLLVLLATALSLAVRETGERRPAVSAAH